MKLRVTIDTTDQEATDYPEDVASAALRSIITDIDRGVRAYTLRDGNGNTIGSWEMSTDA